jgi:dethiobiotin synthetase
MKTLFVAGVGTEIGKTYVTAGIVSHLRARGVEARALKPVASGYDARDARASDPGVLLAAMGLPVDARHLDAISPFRFAAPLAPDMAARREGRTLLMRPIVDFCRDAIGAAEGPIFVEGAGGVMSPMAEDGTCLDLAAHLSLPVLLVTGTYLGAISHTLTAAAALREAKVACAGIVVNESAQGVGIADTIDALARFLPRAVLAPLRHAASGPDWETLAQTLDL